jgi:membrane-associated protease RseP (regulator of RpoE activity)
VASEASDKKTRRALLAGMAAGVAAVALDGTKAAHAADGDKVILGRENTADNPTVITTAGQPAFKGISATDDGALVGENSANDGYGVRGTSPYIGVNAVGGEVGVYTVSDYGKGVQALTYDGVAVHASTAVDAGSALEVTGRARFSRSGKVVIPAGKDRVTVTVGNLDANSLVLATVQERRDDYYVLGAVASPAASTITIHVSRKASKPTTVAWFVVN